MVSIFAYFHCDSFLSPHNADKCKVISSLTSEIQLDGKIVEKVYSLITFLFLTI